MRFNHIGVPVRDEALSAAFYARYFGFDPDTARRYPDGTTILRNADGFDLALHPVQAPAQPVPFLHFGFALPDPASVRGLLERMRGEGVTIVEHDEEPTLVSFKCIDPDGWRIEIYWEQ
jgi:catechol 2,3-dioxygenase-like lactoylglutathione lyase family enzyme